MIDQKTYEKLKAIPEHVWGGIYKRLVKYADDKLRLAGFEKRTEDDIIDAEDFAGFAIDKIFDGTRAWDFEKFPDVEIHLKGIVKSLISSHMKSSRKKPFIQELAQEADSADLDDDVPPAKYFYDDDSGDLCVTDAHWAYIENQFVDDDDGLIIFYDWLDGLPPREIAAQYAMEVKIVYNVIKKCRRVITSLSKVFNNV